MEIILEEILNLVRKKMRENGAYDRDAYKQFVDESIEYFLERGKLTEDDNLEFIQERLLDMWERVRNKFAE